MGRELAITLTDDQQSQLEALASAQNQSADALAQQALEQFLRYEARYRADVQEGIDAVEAGDVYGLDDVAEELRALMAADKVAAGE